MAEYKGKKKQATSTEQMVVENLFKGLWWLISWPFKRGNKSKIGATEKKQFLEYWGQVEFYLAQPTHQVQAVMEADKVLDKALQLVNADGNNLGERLKSSSNLFSSELYQLIWEAHKLRNNIAHEVGMQCTNQQAKKAVGDIKRALINLQLLDY